MKSFLFPLAVLASTAVAQTTSACGADYIVESCVSAQQAKIEACGSENWGCLCQEWKNQVACYINCPNDPKQHSDAGQRDIFCGYESQFPSSTKEVTQTWFESTTAAAQTTKNAAAGDSNNNDSGSATITGAPSTSTNHAADLVFNAGGVLAAVAGVVAAVL